MAMIGVTCKITANGYRAYSTIRDCAKRMASPTPPTSARTSPFAVVDSVTRSEGQSTGQSVRSVVQMSVGDGST